MSYALFSGSTYYPSGGWGDFRGKYESLEDAKEAVEARKVADVDYDMWWHIADLDSLSIVCEEG